MSSLRRVPSALSLAGVALAGVAYAAEGVDQRDPARGKTKGEAVLAGKSGEELDAVIAGLDEPGGFSGCVLVARAEKVPGRQVQHGGNVGHIAAWYFRDLENDVVVAFACNHQLKTDRETLCQRLWTIASNARD